MPFSKAIPDDLPEPPSTLPTLDDTFGAFLIGTVVSLLQYGFLLYQTQEYYWLYPKDRGALKCLVAVTLILQTALTVLNIHTCYYYLVTSYFAPERLLAGVWSINVTPLIAALCIVAAQSFFARRVFLVKGRYTAVVTLLATFLFMAHIAFGTVATERALTLNVFSKARTTTRFEVAMSICAIAADIMVTTVLICALGRRRTGFKNTDSMISVITLYTINTGLLTGIVHVVYLVVTIKYPLNLLYSIVGLTLARLYGNVFLATLIARTEFSQMGMATFGVVTEFPHVTQSMGFTSGRHQPNQSTVAEQGDIVELKPWSLSSHKDGRSSEPNDTIDIRRSSSAHIDVDLGSTPGSNSKVPSSFTIGVD